MTKANGGDKYCKQQFLIILIVLNQIKKKRKNRNRNIDKLP